jgi:small-conductance mechanosensitive channel
MDGSFIAFLIVWIGVSFAFSLAISNSGYSYKFHLIPHYMKRKYFVIMHAINSALIFISMIAFLVTLGSLPHPVVMMVVSFICLLISATIVQGIAALRKESVEETIEEEQERKRKQLE